MRESKRRRKRKKKKIQSTALFWREEEGEGEPGRFGSARFTHTQQYIKKNRKKREKMKENGKENLEK
ncbi:hypothetical protein Sjap_020007 [Stephania japonica]|uniref:Uncharacterized protein n=1 Tax=Stephania japonica TaxID=461633 RepID=A0AAP0F570_9MAGN